MQYHKLQYYGIKDVVTKVCKYFNKYGEVEIRFNDSTTLVCIRDSQKCTWWYENYAYNNPEEQSVYLNTDEMCHYISDILQRKEARKKDISKVIISHDGEDLHIIKFKR